MPSLNTVIKQASRGADLYFVFRFLRLLTMDYKKTDAYKYKIIDAKGNPLRKSSELETTDEKASYTMLHRMVFKIRRLIEKVPIVGKSILLNYAAALFLLKEQNNPRVWTDENYATRKLNEFLENEDWVESAKILREEVEQMSRLKFGEYLTEDGHTDVASAKNQVKIAMDALQKMNTLLGTLPDDGSLPTWWTNKVAIAVDKLDGMADYLDTQVEEVMMDLIQSLEERKMTDAEMDKREKIVLSLKKKKKEFKDRYGDDADSVMYATATKMAMKEDKKWHYYNLDRGVYRMQKDNNGKIIGKMHDRQKEMRAGFPNADEVLSNTKQASAKVAKLNETVIQEKAVSKQQQKFFGLVRAIQKGEASGSPEAEKAAQDMSKKDVKDFASTKHKGLPKKVQSESTLNQRIKELRKKPVKEDWEFDPNTLLQQLGGNKFMVMTGAKNLMVDKKEKSLHMRIGKNSKGINHVKITYMPDDTYKMDFGRIRKMDYKVVRSVTGVYADALQDVFTEVTGMYTSL